jgi:tRNA(His) 5'-end guanylyltransferase
MCSISASMATMAFNKYFRELTDNYLQSDAWVNHYWEEDVKKYANTLKTALDKGAMFDSRCFNIPKEEVCNLIYWRQLDATRNSIQMVGQANFSHKELQNKPCNQIQDMLMLERGINWNDLPVYQKRGSCCIKSEVSTTYAKVDEEGNVITGSTERPHWYIDNNIPIFKGEDREYVDKLIRVDESGPNKVFIN